MAASKRDHDKPAEFFKGGEKFGEAAFALEGEGIFIQPALDVLGEFEGPGIASGGVGGHGAETHSFEFRRDILVDFRGGRRFDEGEPALIGRNRGGGGGGGGGLAREDFVEDSAQGVNVGGGGVEFGFSLGLLGRHVGRRADELALHGEFGGAGLGAVGGVGAGDGGEFGDGNLTGERCAWGGALR